MTDRSDIAGLYAITDETLPLDELFDRTEAILRGGARVLQYRDKRHAEDKQEIAEVLLSLCIDYDALLIINDDVPLAKTVGAHGVHLGREDMTLAAARGELGAGAIIGVSCYNEPALAQRAVIGGANYIAFGSFFPSPTKPDAVRADIQLLRDAQELEVPVVAIGGITPDNGAALVAAGADALAVITGVYRADDPQRAASAYCDLF